MNLPKSHLPKHTYYGTAYVPRSFWAWWDQIFGFEGVILTSMKDSRIPPSPAKSHETLDSIGFSESWDPDPVISCLPCPIIEEIDGRIISPG